MDVIASYGRPYGEGLLDFAVLQRVSKQAVRDAARRLFGFAGMMIA